jgi:hypothetical protein
MADHGDDIAMTTRPGAQNAKAVLGIVEGYTLDETREHFLGRCFWPQGHAKRCIICFVATASIPRTRICDSLAFGATARHVYAAVDDAESKRKLFVRAQNNLAAVSMNQALAFRFAARGSVPTQPIRAPHILLRAAAR